MDLVTLFAGQVSIALSNAVAHRAAEERAETDALTGLRNQGSFHRELERDPDREDAAGVVEVRRGQLRPEGGPPATDVERPRDRLQEALEGPNQTSREPCGGAPARR